MALEEVLDMPYLPRDSYENPVTLAVRNYLLEISYRKDALNLQKHFIDEKGMSRGYEVFKLRPYPKNAIEGIIQNELRARYEIESDEKHMPFSEAPEEIKNNILRILLSHADFRLSYQQLKQGYSEKTSMIPVIANKPTLSDEEFHDILVCYRIMQDALKLVKDEEIKFYLNQADLFDKHLLFYSRTYLKNQKNEKHSKNAS